MITRDDSNDIAVIRLNHGKVSAIDVALCDAIGKELDAVTASSAKALVITGTGSSFSAGLDLFQILEGGSAYLQRLVPALDRMLRGVLTCPKPVVAAVNGHAIAAGCILAAACDHRVMAEGPSRIGVPEMALGLPFPPLALEIVLARVAPPAARTLVYSARTVHAEEAVELGLVDETAEAQLVLDRARQVAEQLSLIPARAFALTKKAFYTPVLGRADALRSDERALMDVWSAPATTAAIRAYLEKTVAKK
ncbi:MAG: enoyl-CoA hydratase/isomerase family protein [Acidobacteriota bacterium]